MRKREICSTSFALFPEVNATIFFINIFMVIVVALVVVVVIIGIMVVDIIIKKISKRHFIIRNGTIK